MIVCFNDEVRFRKNVYKVIYFFVVTILKYKADVFFKKILFTLTLIHYVDAYLKQKMNLKHFRTNLIYGVYVPIYSYTFSNVFFLAKLISRLKPKTIYGINRINKRVYIIIWKQTEKDIFRLDIIMFFYKNLLIWFILSQNVLREEIKDKFKYEVDRTTPSNKIRDFMDWASDIIQDIKYQRKIRSNIVGRMLLKLW